MRNLVVFPQTEVLPKYAVSYLRVSTAKQKEESKTGIKRQDQVSDNWLAAHPEYKTWIEKFQDLEGSFLLNL
tara:strand:+ start:106 stop:321 length:216 start_codon:yes stop_codon:yes gene_type:complete